MSNILVNEIPEAADFSSRVQANVTNELPLILASEVIAEFEKRCGAGQQYTTFPNRISDDEKQKLTDKGWIVTENTIQSFYRNGAPDLYIGFQVALNEKAAEEALAINPKPDIQVMTTDILKTLIAHPGCIACVMETGAFYTFGTDGKWYATDGSGALS